MPGFIYRDEYGRPLPEEKTKYVPQASAILARMNQLTDRGRRTRTFNVELPHDIVQRIKYCVRYNRATRPDGSYCTMSHVVAYFLNQSLPHVGQPVIMGEASARPEPPK